MPVLIFIPGAASFKMITKGLFHEQNIAPIIFLQVAFYLNRSLDAFLLCKHLILKKISHPSTAVN